MATSTVLSLIQDMIPEWPAWALRLLILMSGILMVTYLLSLFFTPQDEKEEKNPLSNGHGSTTKASSATTTDIHKLHSDFNKFRHRYIFVYLIIQFADWMQGTHMYTLYLSYNVNISALFLTGFLSGAIFAPVLGSVVDKFGRKRSCILYCILEIVINLLEHYDNFTILIIGRILGGVSTNLLFSAFESWMTTEHRRQGFPENWLQRTYAEVRRNHVSKDEI